MMGTEENFWSEDLYGTGTMEDSVKDSAIESLHEMYTLKAHMDEYGVELTDEEKSAITEAATTFMESNDSETLEEMGAEQEIVEEILTLYTIQTKMKAAIEAEADTDVSDEEANMRAYSMLTIDTDTYTDDSGESVEYTDEEKENLKDTAQAMSDELVAGGTTLEAVAEAYGYEVTNGTYASDDTSLEDEVKTALDDLQEGELSTVVETDTALYLVRIDSDTDEEATETNRQTIIDTRKSDHYNEVLEDWQDSDDWTVNTDRVAKISFRNSLTQTDPNASTESTESTETEVEAVESTE
jgi:foldase protein PrsA